jgi:hypothetical protein
VREDGPVAAEHVDADVAPIDVLLRQQAFSGAPGARGPQRPGVRDPFDAPPGIARGRLQEQRIAEGVGIRIGRHLDRVRHGEAQRPGARGDVDLVMHGRDLRRVGQRRQGDPQRERGPMAGDQQPVVQRNRQQDGRRVAGQHLPQRGQVVFTAGREVGQVAYAPRGASIARGRRAGQRASRSTWKRPDWPSTRTTFSVRE